MVSKHITPDSEERVQYTHPQSIRLRTAGEFRRCYDIGDRSGDAHLLLVAAASDQGCVRAGVSVSKRHGNAVRRNRRKRLLREAFRLCQHCLPALDFVLVPRQNDRSALRDYQQSLVSLAAQLAKRIDPTQPPDT